MASEREVRVVVVDDHLMVRKGVELLLRSQDIAVVGVADGATHALPMIARRAPHVALVDIGLADGDGIELTARLAEEAPGVNVLLYTGTVESDVLTAALRAGPAGIALKTAGPVDLLEAISVIATGGTYFDPGLAALVETRAPVRNVLSPREREVFTLLARGFTGERIAEQLVLSPETVRTHVRNAMAKLAAKTRVHALALALHCGEVSLGSDELVRSMR